MRQGPLWPIRFRSAAREGGGDGRRGPGDGDRATSTEVSHLGMRRTLPHLLHISNLAPEEGPRLLSQLPHAAPCSRGESCWEHLLQLVFFLRCLQGHEARDNLVRGNWPLAWWASGWGGSKRSGWGWGTHRPWTEQRSWDWGPAWVRCGQPCSRCSLRSLRKLDVSMGGSRGAGDLWQKGCPAPGSSQLGRGRRGGSPRAVTTCKHLGLGRRAGQRLSRRAAVSYRWLGIAFGVPEKLPGLTCLWTAARRSCARGNRTCCRAFARAPGWAFRSAEASSGTRWNCPGRRLPHRAPALSLATSWAAVSPGLADWGLRARPAISVN